MTDSLINLPITYSYYYCKPMLCKYRFDSEQLLDDLDSIVAEAERQQIEPEIEVEDADWTYERDGESV